MSKFEVVFSNRAQYFTASALALFMSGYLPSSPLQAMLLAYLLTPSTYFKNLQ